MTTQIHARCVSIAEQTVGKFTVGKDYPVTDHDLLGDLFDGCFVTADDDGHTMTCWWQDDPYCTWEKVMIAAQTKETV